MGSVTTITAEELAVSRIRLRITVPLVAAATLVLATAGGVLAKCDHPGADGVCPAGMVATFDAGGTLTAGNSETVGVWIHEGEVPYAANIVEVVFSRLSDGTVLRVAAVPTARTGRYEATVEMPAGGTWTLAANIVGPGFDGSIPLDPIQVSPPAAPAAGALGATPMGAGLLLAALAMIAALAAVLGGRAARARRREATAEG